jgi:molybdenum cofactor synthesis domain-containing protein
VRAAVLTLSTSRARDGGEDVSGAKLAELARRLGADEVERELLPDDRDLIESRLRHWVDERGCEFVLTTGGTGLAPSDVTPEATAAVIERPAPGIAEAIRRASQPHTELWMLSRGVAGGAGLSPDLCQIYVRRFKSLHSQGRARRGGRLTTGIPPSHPPRAG